ncbi:hypothetical protein [Penaeicola halotolerans]|uniref:hypothetical protein n=1 Tax=Penaeicola halotolerans TaxID=2793196 RepID=UPI001CF92DD7|nr:hypothetical protein [Penaeicola halotolerans]
MENTITTNQHNQMTVGDWVVTMLITFVPLVNLVMLFVWAFGGNAHPSKETWAKASLIWLAIGIGLYILLFMFIGAAFLSSQSY